MECPYLKRDLVKNVCSASVTLVTPDIYETDKYCTNEDHDRCPALLGHLMRGMVRRRHEAIGLSR